MISSSVQVEFTVGFRRTAQIMALAIISSGVTFTPAKSVEFFKRFTYSMVRVASTSTKMLTCGAVKADLTMALAIALRTPLTGMRSSRSFGASGVVRFRKTLAWVAPAKISSRVISPPIPEPRTVLMSTFRSRANLRTGGLATTGSCGKSGVAIGNSLAGLCATGNSAAAAATAAVVGTTGPRRWRREAA